MSASEPHHVELSEGMYRALCGLVHPSEAANPADVIADAADWERLRAMFPLEEARTVHTEDCPRCGQPGYPRGTTREGTAWNCEGCGLPFQVIES